MTGIVIGSIESGKSVIGVNGNGIRRATTEAGLEMIGATTMNTVDRKATGTTTMKMTAGEVTINAKGTGCCVRHA